MPEQEHEFASSYSGMCCGAMVMRDGAGTDCGLQPSDPVHIQPNQEWFVTFGRGHSDPPGLLSNSYWRVKAPDELEARRLIIEKLGYRWAFVYTADEFEDQIEKYGLTEVQP